MPNHPSGEELPTVSISDCAFSMSQRSTFCAQGSWSPE